MTMQTIDFSTGPSTRFFEYLREGRFMIQRSRSTGSHTFYPRVVMPATGEIDLEWVEASGRGSVYSSTRIPRKPERGGDYTVAIVELEEGPRMMTNIVDIPATEVYIGQPVSAKIDLSGDKPRVVFAPVSDGNG